MLFNSFEFIVLLVITLIIYYLPIFRRFQIYTLILSSFIFYGWTNPSLCILLFISILVNAVVSYSVCGRSDRGRIVALGVIYNLTILLFFKYNRLIADTFSLNTSENYFIKLFVGLPLPIGISFYTFQGISLILDCKRAESREILNSNNLRDHIKNTAFFKAFFPQLIAGPIVRAQDFLFQIKEKKLQDMDVEAAVKFLILGYFLKCFVADNLKEYTSFWMSYPFFANQSSLDLLAVMYGYSFQIFADFAGYSYMALGLAELFGYKLLHNFNFPYIAKSFSDFWRRWHISLSTFLKDYLYRPLGGNSISKVRTYFNLFVVMFLGGLWHGASWTYANWGALHGVYLSIERSLGLNIPRLKESAKWAFVKTLFVFNVVSFMWLMFQLPSMGQAVLYVKTITINFSIRPNSQVIPFVIIFSIPVILLHLNHIYGWTQRKIVAVSCYAVMLFLIYTNIGPSRPFIYFQF